LNGPVATFAHPTDSRFAFALFVPEHPPASSAPGLLVTVHDSTRNHLACTERFAPFAQAHGLVVLAPLFPRNVLGDGQVDGYKFLCEPGLRYDQLLHEMIDEATRRTGCDGTRFFLQGYSGGAQFVHRYLLLHPERLRAASVGAPGVVTLPDERVDWWAGVRDLDSAFGRPFNPALLRNVPIQLIVSDGDTETWEIREQPPSGHWPVEADRLRSNRVDRLRVLHRALLGMGANSQLTMLRGLPHGQGPGPAATLAQQFFAEQLTVQV
jgi:poly(3-hydroxybutyrate) depolymerase